MLKIKTLVVLATVLSVCLLWDGARAEVVKVTLVEVQGNRRIETATVLAKIKTKEGGVFDPVQIKEDIKTLYQLGHFEDVQVKTEGFEDGVKVIFFVREKPLIREITFEGNEEIDTEDLKQTVTILPRSAFNVQAIYDNAEKIRLRYQDRGYYNAVVVPIAKELKGGDRNLVFYIEEGEKIRLEEIIITGNKAISTKEIKKALKTEEHNFFSFLGRGGTLRTEELRQDIEAIRNLYYNKGYIQVQIDEPVIENRVVMRRVTIQDERVVRHDPPLKEVKENQLTIRIKIKEGDQFRVGAITIKGNRILSKDELMREVRLKTGEVFSRQTLREDVNRLMDRYDSIARPFANVSSLFDIDPDRKTVAVTFDIDEGGEVRIGRIDITGNTNTRDKVIRREMRLDEGDLYSKRLLRRSYERIYNLNFFETIDITPERRGQEPIMDLNIKVKEKLTGTASIGGGYSSVDGFIGIADVTWGNFLGRGQLLKFKTQFGGKRRVFVMSFTEPYLFDKPLRGTVDIFNQNQEYDGYSIDSNGFGLGLGKSYGEYVSASLRYSLDRSEVIDYNINTLPSLTRKQVNEYGPALSTSSLTASLVRDSRDFYLDPKEGSRNSIFVEYAGGPLGGDTRFIKSVADSGWYFPLFWDTVFMLRGRIGYAGSLIDKPLPVGERFFIGGVNSVRGFRYGFAGPTERESAIDPKDPSKIIYTGNYIAVGGNKELIFNAEFTFPIVAAARLTGVLFYDAGKGFLESESISIRELRQSVGWGFRWLTPIGPLRFEWGYIINERPEDRTSQFEFSIGSLF